MAKRKRKFTKEVKEKLLANNGAVRERFERKAKPTTSMSKENKLWEAKRKKRYQEKVWRGWRESDGEEHPVTVTRIEDLQ